MQQTSTVLQLLGTPSCAPALPTKIVNSPLVHPSTGTPHCPDRLSPSVGLIIYIPVPRMKDILMGAWAFVGWWSVERAGSTNVRGTALDQDVVWVNHIQSHFIEYTDRVTQ